MQLSDLLALFLAFIAATAAWPFSNSRPVKRDDDDDLYYLKTKVLNGGSQDYDGLYVQSYHTGISFLQPLLHHEGVDMLTCSPTGAGLSDATLGTKDHAVAGFLNGTVQQFNLSSFPWSFFLPQPTSYDGTFPSHLALYRAYTGGIVVVDEPGVVIAASGML